MKNLINSFLILLLLQTISNISVAFSFNTNLTNDSNFKFTTTSTGNTTGKIGVLIIENLTDEIQKINLDSYFIPSKNNKPAFVIYQKKVVEVEIAPRETHTHLLEGYSIYTDQYRITKDIELPHFTTWLSSNELNSEDTKNWKANPSTINLESDVNLAATLLIDAINNLENQYKNWQKPLQIPKLYASDKLKTVQTFIQQAFWQFSSSLLNKNYNYPFFKSSIYKQKVVENWLQTNGEEIIAFENDAVSKKALFEMQTEKLWKIISDLNAYSNPAVRKLFEQPNAETQHPNVVFQPLWESIELTGNLTKMANFNKTSETTSFAIALGPTSLLPVQSKQSLYKHNLSLGAGVKVMYSPKKLNKLRFHIGAAYIPFTSEFDGAFEALSVKVDALLTDSFDETPYSINVKSKDNIKEKLNYNTLQIPIGISYNILNFGNTKLLIDVIAKPHFKLGKTTYDLDVTSIQYKVTYFNFGTTPLILGEQNYKETNEIETQYSDNSNFTQINEPNINSPFALAAGIQLLQKLGIRNTKINSYIGIHIHNNVYLQQPGWKAADDDITESDFTKYLINQILQAEDTKLNNALSQYHTKDAPASFFEVGLSYIIKL